MLRCFRRGGVSVRILRSNGWLKFEIREQSGGFDPGPRPPFGRPEATSMARCKNWPRPKQQSSRSPKVLSEKRCFYCCRGGNPTCPEVDQLGEITSLIDSGIIRPVVDRIFPFESTKEAMAYVEKGRARGKVVVKVKSEPPYSA